MTESRLQRVVALAAAVGGLMLFAPTAGQAQTGKLTGVATDATTGAPVEGVQVFIVGTGFGTATQANGRFFIINVPPGTYTLRAQRIGYRPAEVVGVDVRIDVTREVNFKLSTAARELVAERIVAEQAPLVEVGTTGSSTTITSDVIQSLPVTSISGVLALQQGFTEVPQNTNLQSLAEEQRSTVAPIRVRGGRGGATISLIDGIPINNPVIGTEAVRLNPLAVSSVEFNRGGMEPQYGNGLSGVINQAVREGGTSVAGSIDYRTSAVAGALGSDADDVAGYNLFRGGLSGPVPGTAAKLRYSVSGQIESGAARVLKFDNDVSSFAQSTNFGGRLPPATLDRGAGWQGFGGNQNQQFVGKLTFLPTASGATHINFLVIDQQRQALNYDRRFLMTYLAGNNPLGGLNNRFDSLGLGVGANCGGFPCLDFRDVLQASVRDQSRLYVGGLDQRFGRTALTLRVARMDFERNTCNIFLGVCVEAPFLNGNFTEQFYAPGRGPTSFGIPFQASDLTFGGETYKTNTVRADLASQVTDHHLLQFGGSFVQHDITYRELRGISGNSGPAPVVPQLYRAKPIEAAAYLQDRLEYDFLTVKLGARFDYGRAKGKGFANPLDPTNGTTARQVCDNPTRFGLPGNFATAVNDKGTADPSDDVTLTGTAACLFSPNGTTRSDLFVRAISVAQRDDFKEAPARKAFSPRIGVSFPLTERSQVFFNAGRYTMNPLYANVYRNTGIGTVAGSQDGFCKDNEVKPGTNECVPPLKLGNPDFVGNPNLLLEQATQYEVGYGAEIGRGYAVNVAVYNRDESGLSGIKRPTQVTQDVGSTYSGQSSPQYITIINQDFLTSRGMEVQFRRRLRNHWQFDINYGWSRSTTNSPPPDRSFEIQQGGEIDRTALREITSEIDQTHRFNATVGLAAAEEPLHFRFGGLLRNTSASLTYRFSSGFPYTPIAGNTFGNVTNTVNAADINAGRAPSTSQVDAIFQKGFRVKNVRYGAFVQITNLLDRKNCVQVFVNTGTCDSGLRDPINRRVGNFDESTSTNFDQPEFVGQRRQISTGLSVSF